MTGSSRFPRIPIASRNCRTSRGSCPRSSKSCTDELEAKTLKFLGLAGTEGSEKARPALRQGELGGEEPALESGIRLLLPPDIR
jgi:hypothetical protein